MGGLVATALLGYIVGNAIGIGNERFIALGLPALVVFVLMYRIRADRLGIVAALVVVGNASYALYLFHPFAIEAVKQILVRRGHGVDLGPAFIPFFVASCLIASVAGAILFYYSVEMPVLKRLQRALSLSSRRHRSSGGALT